MMLFAAIDVPAAKPFVLKETEVIALLERHRPTPESGPLPALSERHNIVLFVVEFE
jgi:hypothetical protein